MHRVPLSALACILLAGTVAVQAADNGTRALDYFRGTWECAGVFPASGRHIASRMRFTEALDGTALVKRHRDKAPGRYRALEVWGYDTVHHRYSATVFDNGGGARLMHSRGWRKGVLTWTVAGQGRTAQRFVYAKIDAGAFRVDWRVARDGTHYVTGDTLTCHRRPGTHPAA